MPSVVRDQDIRVVNQINEQGLIEDLVFEGCRIIGPAVLAFVENVEMLGCSFDTRGWSDLAWVVPTGRTGLAGAIGLKNTTFRRCRFLGIGLAIPEAQEEAMRAGFEGPHAPSA